MKYSKGLTLIEVLVALAIVSIAMTAIIKASAQTIRATQHLQIKTIATWYGQYLLNDIKLGQLRPPEETESSKAMVLGNVLYWKVKNMQTPNKHIKKLTVGVYTEEPEEETAPIIQLDEYYYVETNE